MNAGRYAPNATTAPLVNTQTISSEIACRSTRPVEQIQATAPPIVSPPTTAPAVKRRAHSRQCLSTSALRPCVRASSSRASVCATMIARTIAAPVFDTASIYASTAVKPASAIEVASKPGGVLR